MKQQVFYIHGASAYSKYEHFLEDLKTMPIRNLPNTAKQDRWTKTLAEDLGEGYEVFTPEMPNKQNAKYEEWKIWFERHFEFIRDDIILLGWSQGAYFLAKYLSENTVPFKIKALFMLAGPFEPDSFGLEDGGDFVFAVEDLTNLSKQVEHIELLHSKDDFVVPYEHALKYKAALPNAELVTYEDKNHFLIEHFPELLDRIKAV